MGRACGYQPTSLFGRSDSLVVVFRTDNDVVNKGWNMSWPAGEIHVKIIVRSLCLYVEKLVTYYIDLTTN